MIKYTTFLLLLTFVFVSLVLVSLPAEQLCMICGNPGIPGQHECPVREREKQELQVQLDNERAERERLENKYNNDQDKSLWDLTCELWQMGLSTSGQAVIKIGEWITDKEGMERCQSCDDWVYSELEHWGTGNCKIGHVHWTCGPGAKEHHGACYWVDEPETNPDRIYEGSNYSWSCWNCSYTCWTNSYDELMGWVNNPCSICGR